MRLATLADGTRDGRLVVVSRDGTRATGVPHIARTLQGALDDWERAAPRLLRAAETLEGGAAPAERFHERACLSPLPRAYQWADGSAYVNHVELVRRARGAAMPEAFWTDPLMYQGGSDGFLPPRAPIRFPREAEGWGVDFEGEVAVIVGDVPMGADEDAARRAIRLVMLCNDVSLRALVPGEIAKGFGFFQSKPASAFSPLAVAPEALGRMWDGERLHGALRVERNGEPFGRADAGADMVFGFPRLIAHAARTRALGAGTIVGSGTVSNRPGGAPARAIADGGPGHSCIAEARATETLEGGQARTPFLRHGDTVRIAMNDGHGRDAFGAIEQRVELGEAP